MQSQVGKARKTHEGIRGARAELKMVPALTVRRRQAFKGSVAGTGGWSL